MIAVDDPAVCEVISYNMGMDRDVLVVQSIEDERYVQERCRAEKRREPTMMVLSRCIPYEDRDQSSQTRDTNSSRLDSIVGTECKYNYLSSGSDATNAPSYDGFIGYTYNLVRLKDEGDPKLRRTLLWNMLSRTIVFDNKEHATIYIDTCVKQRRNRPLVLTLPTTPDDIPRRYESRGITRPIDPSLAVSISNKSLKQTIVEYAIAHAYVE